MRKKLIITIAAAGVIAVLGLSLFQSGASSNEPTLSTAEIRKLVQAQYPPGTITSLVYEENANEAAYKVELDSDGNLYTIRLNGNTGEVLDLKVDETVTNHAQDNPDNKEQKETGTSEDQSKESKQDESAKEKNTTGQKEETNTEESASNAMISTERAKEIALGEFSGTVIELELDEDDGLHLYEVEIENGEDEATIEIDAYTGKVLMLEMDIEDDDDGN